MAAMDSARSTVSLRTVQHGQRHTFAKSVPSIMPATVLRTKGHPLARMHSNWGVIFVGSKEQLQSAGFGVGAIFPGEPGGNKKKATFPACNGFAKIEVRLYEGNLWLGAPSQSVLQNYEISASYIDVDNRFKREFEPVPDMPEVLLYRDIRTDVYRGSAQALISALLIDASHLPGRAGNGKMQTTFTRSGDRIRGRSTGHCYEGSKTIKAVGKLLEVAVEVNDAEYESRHSDFLKLCRVRESERDQKIAEYLRKIAVPSTVATSRTKSHLKLVWSA